MERDISHQIYSCGDVVIPIEGGHGKRYFTSNLQLSVCDALMGGHRNRYFTSNLQLLLSLFYLCDCSDGAL